MWLLIRYAEKLYRIIFKILQNFFSVLSLKEIIIITIIIPEILFDTEYIAFSVFGLAFLLLARQSLYKYTLFSLVRRFRFISVSSVIKNILAPITMRIIFISHWTDYYFISRRTNGRRFRGSQMAEIAERPCGMFSLRQSLWELSLSITEETE